jgi:branched-chain amino acid transport system substrate-binding protein
LAVNNLGQTAGPTEIGLLIKDTGSNAEQAAGAVDALAQAGVTAIIGPIGGAEAAARRAQENRIPIITLTQKSDIVDIGDFVFRNFLTPGLQARALAEHAVAVMGLRRIAVLYPDEPYGRRFMLLFWKELVQFGGRITGIESYSADQTDFATPIKKLGRVALRDPGGPQAAADVGHRASRRLAADPAGSRGCAASRRSPGPPESRTAGIHPRTRPSRWWTSKRCLSRMRLTWSALSPRSWPSMTSKGFACSAPTSGTPSVCWTSVESMSRTLCFPTCFSPTAATPTSVPLYRPFETVFGERPGFVEAVSYDSANLLFGILTRAGVHTPTSLKQELIRQPPVKGVTGLPLSKRTVTA